MGFNSHLLFPNSACARATYTPSIIPINRYELLELLIISGLLNASGIESVGFVMAKCTKVCGAKYQISLRVSLGQQSMDY